MPVVDKKRAHLGCACWLVHARSLQLPSTVPNGALTKYNPITIRHVTALFTKQVKRVKRGARVERPDTLVLLVLLADF
jgi:hypothetical protein